jgi:hypothetical protein
MRNLSIIILLAFIVISCNDEPVETVYAFQLQIKVFL